MNLKTIYNVRITNSGLSLYAELMLEPTFEGYNLPNLMRKQSQGKFLTKDEKNYVTGHAQRIRKERLIQN